jgi:hypothetical protein
MTAKEIYEIIDLDQLPKDKADKLRELEVKTKGFSIQNERVEETMRNLYTQLKEKKPSALKDLKVEIKKVETTKGKEVIVKETEKVVGKKEVTKKNPTPSSSKKETITEVAKKIRKADEPWRQALKRAGEEMRKRDDEASKQVKTELQKLVDFVKNDPNFKDFPRTYGKGRKDIDLLKDASEKALAPGRRVSQKGHMNQYGASKGGRKYTENRDNRSDREASKFPKNIFLAEGGKVHRAEQMESGGEVFVPVQIDANNPNVLVNTTTMTELFAEGGIAPTRKLFEDGGALYQGNMDADYITYGEILKSGGKLKYDPARDVQAIVIQDGPLKKMFIKGDYLGGAYRLASGGLSEDYIYVSPRKVIFARLKSGEDIKPSNGFWIKKNASGTIYTGSAKAKPAFVKSKKFPLPKKITLSYPLKENDKIMKLLGEFSGKEDLRPATSFVSIKDGELVSTNANYLIRLMDPTTKGENELVCESKFCQNIKKTDLKYPDVNRVIESFEADFSESYDFVDLYESVMQAREDAYEKLQRRSKNTFVVTNVEFKNNDIKFDSRLLLQALKGAISLGMQKGFISYSESKSQPIALTPSEVTTDSKYRVLGGKDLILLMPVMRSGYESESSIVAKQVDIMEAGMNETKQVTKEGTYSFPEGQVVWDLGNKSYGVVLNNFGDSKNGDRGEIRLDSDGMQSIYDYPDTSKYNLVPIGSPEDRGDGNLEKLKESAKYIIGMAGDAELKDYYKKAYKRVLAGEFDKFKKMESGGEVFVPVQIDANNPDVLVGTNTMYEMFADGGIMAQGGALEGKKRFNEMYNVGRAKYVVSFHDGVKKHNDGSDFFDLRIFKNKKDLEAFKKELLSNGYLEHYAHGGMLEEQSLEMAQNISTQIAHHAEELKDALNGKTYVEPWVTSMLQRAADNLSDATHYLEGKEEKMAKGGKLRNGKENYEKGDEGMYEGNEVRVVKLDTELVKYIYDVLDEDGNVNTHGLAPKDKFERQFAYFPKMAKGGYVAVAEKDGYWYIISTPSSKENSQKLLDMTTLMRGEVGKVVTIDEAKAYNKVIGREYLEKDGMMAKGGKIREFDDVLIISKNKLGMVEAIGDNIYYVTTPFGETFEATIDDLKKIMSFDKGGEVMIGEIASIAKENKVTGDEVVKKISKGADVEMEHTEDRKFAMRIAADHLKEDFNYYEKLRKAGL